MGHTSFMVIL